MSCPSWFPRALLARDDVFAAMRAANVVRQLAPTAVWPVVMGITTGLEAGVYLARGDCDAPRAACLWATQQREDLEWLLRSDDWVALAGRAFYGAVGVLGYLEQLFAALQLVPPCDLVEATVEDEDLGENPDPTGPMFVWSSPLTVPHVTANANGLGLAYGHAYQRAAAATYAQDPNADLRPWVLQQAQIDLAYVDPRIRAARAMLINAAASFPVRVPRLRQTVAALTEAQRRLNNFATAAASDPLGPWSRDTVLRVLRSAELQTNLPVVGGDGGQGGEDSGGGGAFAVGAVVLGLLAAMR